jgi:hypothetical protein
LHEPARFAQRRRLQLFGPFEQRVCFGQPARSEGPFCLLGQRGSARIIGLQRRQRIAGLREMGRDFDQD